MKVRELLTVWNLKVDQATLDKFSRGIDLAKKAMVGAVVGVAALSAAIFKLAHSAMEYIDSSNEMAQSAGVTTAFFQELAYAASYAGVTTEQLTTSLAFFQRNIHGARKGSKEAAEAFQELGVTQRQLKTLGSEALFTLVADKLSKIEDPAKRGALAMSLLGRGGAKLIPAFEGGAAALAAAGDEARRWGLVTGPEAEKQAAALERGLGQLKGAIKGLLITVGTALMPVITDLAQRVLEWYKANQKIITSKLREWLVALGKFVAALADGVVKLIRSIARWVEQQGGMEALLRKTGAALSSLVDVFRVVGAVISFVVSVLREFGELLGAVAAIFYQVFTGDFKGALNTWWEYFKHVFGGVGAWFHDNVIAPIVATWNAAIDAIVRAIDFVVAKLTSARNMVVETLNLLPGVNIGKKTLAPEILKFAGTAVPVGTPGAKSTNFTVGDINVSVGGSSASAGEISGSVQKVVRDEFDRMLRHAGADMGR